MEGKRREEKRRAVDYLDGTCGDGVVGGSFHACNV